MDKSPARQRLMHTNTPLSSHPFHVQTHTHTSQPKHLFWTIIFTPLISLLLSGRANYSFYLRSLFFWALSSMKPQTTTSVSRLYEAGRKSASLQEALGDRTQTVVPCLLSRVVDWPPCSGRWPVSALGGLKGHQNIIVGPNIEKRGSVFAGFLKCVQKAW